MIKQKYYCDWCNNEMPKLNYFLGSHIIVCGHYNYDETAITDCEEHVCNECYEDFIKLRHEKETKE